MRIVHRQAIAATMNHKPDMNVGEESDGRVVPAKRPDKAGKPSVEGAEGRRATELGQRFEWPAPCAGSSKEGGCGFSRSFTQGFS
jgi:hypothetical protein